LRKVFFVARFLIACLLLTFLGEWCVYAQEYFAKGQIEVVVKSGPSPEGKTNSIGFYVEVLGTKYRIKIVTSDSDDRYYEYTSEDGVMYILHHVTGISRSLNNRHDTRTNDAFPVRIEEREIPPNDGTRAQFVWLALASHSFFANLTSNYMAPIWSPEDPQTRRQPFSMPVVPELFRESPRLPLKVSFLNDGVYRSYNPATKRLDEIPLNPPFDRGYTNAVYQAIVITNTPKNTLPAEFVFVVYSSPLNPGELPFERVMIRGMVNEVGDFAPGGARMGTFSGRASVVDYRVKGVVRTSGRIGEYKYAAYPVTNAAWLNSNQLAVINKRTEKKEALRLKQRFHSSISRLLKKACFENSTLKIIGVFA